MKPESHALYRFYGDTGQLLYVGITNDPARRISQHAAKKNWWRAVRGISLEWYSNREDAAAAEKRAIAIEKPMTNIVRPEMSAPQWRCGHCDECYSGARCRGDVTPRACQMCESPNCSFTAGSQTVLHKIVNEIRSCTSPAEVLVALKDFLGPGAFNGLRCGHCGGCLDGDSCTLFNGPREDEDAECGPCMHCGKDTCLYSLGKSVGDMHGWSHGYDAGRDSLGMKYLPALMTDDLLTAVVDGQVDKLPEFIKVGI